MKMAPPLDWQAFADWIPTHMARQLPNGAWTSKCGANEDIAHFTLDALERYGALHYYGCPVVYMRRLKIVGCVARFLQRILWKIEKIEN